MMPSSQIAGQEGTTMNNAAPRSIGKTIKTLVAQEFEKRGDPPRRFDRTRKGLVLLMLVLTIGAIVFITARTTQSSFIAKTVQGKDVFLDKYLGSSVAKGIAAQLPELSTDYFTKLGIHRTNEGKPAVYFFTDRHYGIIRATDRLLQKRLRDRSSSDMSMLRTISFNLYANELASDSITSRDGAFVFVTYSDTWKKSTVHAEAHASAAAAMPQTLRTLTSADANFDQHAWYAFRFMDETAAIFLSELYAIDPSGSKPLDPTSYRNLCRPAYDPENGPLAEKESFIWMATYDPPSKSAAFFSSAFEFGAFLLDSLGYEGMLAMLGRFITGDYKYLDELFLNWGGLEGALVAWSTSPTLPR